MKSVSVLFWTLSIINITVTKSLNYSFATINNGGFEDDKKAIESDGGIFTMLPSGWTGHSSTLLVAYSVHHNYYQSNSGEIFLSIFGSRTAHIEQIIYACPGLEMVLSFSAASYECDECHAASFNVSVDSQNILRVHHVPFSWTIYHARIIATTSTFTLRFAPDYGEFVQLFIDNVSLDYGDSSCSPTPAPTNTELPTPSPSITPTLKPSAAPSTPYPTGVDLMLIAEGRITLKNIAFSTDLSTEDLSVITEVLSDIIAAGAKPVRGLTRVSNIVSKRVNKQEMAILFNVDILDGAHDPWYYNFETVFNETRAYLDISTRVTDIFLTKLQIILETVNGTSLHIYSTSAVTMDYFQIGDGTHTFTKEDGVLTLGIALLSGFIGFFSILLVYMLITRMRKPTKEVDDDTLRLLEMSNKGYSVSHSGSANKGGTLVAEAARAASAVANSDLKWEKGPSASNASALMQESDITVVSFRDNNHLHSQGDSSDNNNSNNNQYLNQNPYDSSEQDETPGKFYSAFASRKNTKRSNQPVFEKIDMSSTHSMPEQSP